jgi:DNA mismatch endonuclease, patch repair protein
MGSKYLRDGRAPIPKSERTSVLMSRIRSKNTAPERQLREALRACGLTGYRLHHKTAPGKPDVAYIGARVAVFVHGCFWHLCPHCKPRQPSTHPGFWSAKLLANQTRDKAKCKALRKLGWSVIVIWACQLKRPARQVARVKLALQNAAQPDLRPNTFASRRRSNAQKKSN